MITRRPPKYTEILLKVSFEFTTKSIIYRGVIKIKIIFALYYITLFTWFNDENESLEKTMSVLDKYLNNIEKVIKFS